MKAKTTAPIQGEDGGRDDEVGAASSTSLPRIAPQQAATGAPALHQLSLRGREIASEYYASGYTAGLAAGWSRCEASYAEHHDIVRQILARIGQPFDALAERRGQPERAERHRRLMQSRGVA